MSVYDKYESVIGLEVHIQLLTKSKAYSSDSTEFGDLPNTNVSVITLGHPGTLPKANKKVLEFAVRLGIACNCNITRENQYARKNYFYPDLPKGYQITQDKTPICTGGYITIKAPPPPKGGHPGDTSSKIPPSGGGGASKRINLTRIHWEEDAGKSIHDQDPYDTLIDLNRAGVPLLEMVSEPEIASGEEAYKYLTEVRKLVRYLDICDGNMEEGNLRCDANISVRLKGVKTFGKRTEVKNMNSIRNVQKAIDHEIKRQIDLIKKGEIFEQETRGFDATTGTTFSLRSKEFAHDYRYFPEPDLQPVVVEQEYISEIKKTLPPLPDQLFKKYTREFGLSDYDAGVLTDTKEIALYFEKLTAGLTPTLFEGEGALSPKGRVGEGWYKAACNWVTGSVKSYLNENAVEIDKFPLTAEKLSELIKIVEEGKVSHSVASQKIFPALVLNPAKSPMKIAEELNLIQESNTGSLKEFAKQAIEKYPEKVAEYKSGKTGLIGLFMGEVMKLSKGKADPKIANQLVKEILDTSP
ncbi:MAG: Asp-tRNA(Asn)/Glu-tRNA(Gln) amidotransferase subunit GatB [Bacteroidetes bacterium]|nr:MAG: Asp-tRNA(Asn)/Glu-tRNA(Gln) amidotransferase subunit GatB [Bacteroidota bacterium]